RPRLPSGRIRSPAPGDHGGQGPPGPARPGSRAGARDPRRGGHPGPRRQRPQPGGCDPGSAPARDPGHGPRHPQAGVAAGRRGDRRARAARLPGMLSGLNPAIAFLAGLASFVSPCVLPLVPAYLAYLGATATPPHPWGGGPEGRRGAAGGTISKPPIAVAGAAFVAGLSLIFI